MEGRIPLLRLEELRAIQERETYLLVQAEKVVDTPKCLSIEIEDNPVVAMNKASRRVLEIEEKDKWRWPAGGAATVVELKDGQQLLLTVHRDEGAPTYANHDTIGSGLGGSMEEICYPLRTALREGVEEIFLKTPKGLVCPRLENDCFGFGLELESVITTGARFFSKLNGLPLVQTKARLIDLPGAKEVQVVWRSRRTACRALICLDQEVRGIDVLTVLYLKLDCSLGDLAVFDGEIIGGNLINRIVNGYELRALKPTGKIIASWQAGNRREPEKGNYPYKLTPVLQAIFEALEKLS